MKPIENTSRLRWIESHWDAFLQMAQDIQFISRFSVSGFLLGVRIKKVLLYDLLPVRKKWEHNLEYDPVLDLCSSEHLGEYIVSLAYDHYKLSTQIPYMPAFLQLRICRILFGDIQQFVSRRL